MTTDLLSGSYSYIFSEPLRYRRRVKRCYACGHSCRRLYWRSQERLDCCLCIGDAPCEWCNNRY